MSQRFDRYSSLVFFIIGMGFVYESGRISASAYGSSVGPDIFPKMLGIILILLSIRLFYETRFYSTVKAKTQALDYKKFIIILVSAVLYGLLLEPLGYVLTTFIFLTIGFQTMEKGGWWKTLLISGGFSYGIYYLFVEVLEGSLPGFPVWFN